ncbi:MAG: penicillin-binding protein 2 [Rickettsiales bacterium]|jgi:penicillin-binding protein 2|nr:penicillin-binding protein 2 [Rickettsiales bacterium]
MRDAELLRMFNRRALLVAGGELFLFSILAGRLYHLQVVDSSKYKRLSDRNSIRIKLSPAPRGIISDRNGVELALNRNSYGVQMIPEEVMLRGVTVDGMLESISALVPLSEAEKDKIRNNIRKKKAFFPVSIKSGLTWDDMAKLQVKNLEFPGVYVEEGKQRRYPLGEIAAHVIGYVASVSDDDLRADPDPMLSLPDFRVGKTGIEKMREKELRGASGETIQIVNANGRVIETLEDRKKRTAPGRNISLTIDSRLQQFACERIREESASALVMDIYTGDVLCMVSVPAYDPNIFQNDETVADEFKKLLANPRHPFINKSVEGMYAPGSTFKIMTALAALADGKLPSSTRHQCAGHFDFGDSRYHCWRTAGHGAVDFEHAFQWSCDVYFYNVATKMNMDLIQEMAYRFGLGEATGVGLMGERRGQVPSRSWKRNYKSEMWYTGDTITASIGQGYTLATPIQLAVMTARVANGGIEVRPRIVRSENEDAPAFPQMNVDPSHLALVKNGMYAVVNREGATGRSAAINVHGMQMCGKTGTTQVRRISREERIRGVIEQSALPWRYRNHALFVGYAPHRNPRYAVSVVVEHGISGSGTAAPIARDLMKRTLELNMADLK